MLRRPLEFTLHAAVAVMHEVVDVGPGMKRLLQGVQRQVASKRVRHTPAYDLARENVRDERHVHEADPRRHVGQVRDPELVRALGRKAPLDEIRRPRGCLIDDRGLLVLPAADRTPEAHLAHQTLHRTPRHADSLPTQSGRLEWLDRIVGKDLPHRPSARSTSTGRSTGCVRRSSGSGRSTSGCTGLGRSGGSCLQIGSTPCSSRCSSMNDTITSVGGRAPPERNTQMPSEGSRWLGGARDSLARERFGRDDG